MGNEKTTYFVNMEALGKIHVNFVGKWCNKVKLPLVGVFHPTLMESPPNQTFTGSYPPTIFFAF